ncbi:MAG: hypothetical protein WCD11_35065 [Solirubrobacteraceae bacterium]
MFTRSQPRPCLGRAGNTCFCGAGVYLALTKGQYSGGYTAVSVASLAVMLSAGPLRYLGSRYVRRRQGIDIALAMRELPPE